MLQFLVSKIFVVIVIICGTHGMLVVGPKFIRSKQDYTLVLTNFNSSLSRVDLKVEIYGKTEAGETILQLNKTVDVRRYQNRLVNFQFPNLVPGYYKITLDGQRGFSFHKEADLVFLSKSVSGLIQLDKPVYKPGDSVRFRVIVLDTELKPPANIKTVNVTIQDPRGNVIRKWSAGRLYVGVFDSKFQIAPAPLLGQFDISVNVGDEEIVSRTFEVKEYLLSTFEIDVYPTVVPLENHQRLELTVSANYFTGKPVQGMVIISLFLESRKLDQSKTFNVNGIGHTVLNFNGNLYIDGNQTDVQINATFIETVTNRTLTKQKPITVFKYPYEVSLVKESAQFRPGKPYQCEINFRYHNGTPAANITAEVIIDGIGTIITNNFTSDQDGVIKLNYNTSETETSICVKVTVEGADLLNECIEKVEIDTGAYVKAELKSRIILNKAIRLSVTCTERMTFVVYYVVSKGKIIDSGYKRLSKATKLQFEINGTRNMVPKSKIIIATLANETIVYDVVDIEFGHLLNKFSMWTQDAEVKPGGEIQLDIDGLPKAYAAFAAYDKSLLQQNANHGVFWESIMTLFDEFHDVPENQHSKIHSMGLFARTVNNITIEGVLAAGERSGRKALELTDQARSSISFRTNFLESWLWENVTINKNGRYQMIENVPDTTTSWYLTGFSMDPEYGLGIIKNPIEITTVQPFYIVDNLPYSIKRGEAVSLQFTLFNNLGADYLADVTMYNIGDQTEFIGQPRGVLSYTKSIKVQHNVGVPISFLIKANTIGEMPVRLKASIMLGMETDAIEKIIRVMPESLVEKKMESRICIHNVYANQSFAISLDIPKKADAGSQQINLVVTPSILTTVVQNLHHLLELPTGCGEQTMTRFIPGVIVLDYLHAIGLKDTHLERVARSNLTIGYQNQMKFHQTDGSFDVWHNGRGNVFITAFVAKSLQTASKYIHEVDITKVAKSFAWLASKQHSSGRFVEDGLIVLYHLQRNSSDGIALTSYVLIAFLENENAKVKYPHVVAKGVQYVADRLAQVNDLYDLSIATYAMMLSNHTSKESFISKLLGMNTNYENGTMKYWSREPFSVETTSYALLAMIQAGMYVDGVPVMRWLVSQRYYRGGFPRTQDTFVGLKALTKLTEIISPARNDYTLQLKYSNTSQSFSMNYQDIKSSVIKKIPSNVRKIDINIAGRGFALLSLQYEYAMDLRNYKNRFNLTLENLSANSNYQLTLKICASFIPKLAKERSNMALVEVNFPSGYVVDHNPITEATNLNPIKNTEIRFGGTSVVAYYDNMGTENNCFHITAYRRFLVALKRPAHVLVYDYYDPRLFAVQVYTVDQENLCDICDNEDCPEDCKEISRKALE